MTEQAASSEVADELVDEASISNGKAIVRFTKTEAALNDLRAKYQDAKYDLTTTQGDTAARRGRRELVSLRTGLDKRRKELKLPAIEFNRKIDSEALRIAAEIEALERPIDLQIKQDERRREEERLAKQRAAEARAAGFRQRIEDISNVAVRAVGMTSDEIATKIELVTRIAIDDGFEEFQSLAGNTKLDTLLRLRELHSAALTGEAAAAEAKATRERLAQLERENAERLARESAERLAREAEEAQQRELRAAQSALAYDLVDETRMIQRRAFHSSALGLLELVSLVENLRVGDELGDFAGIALKAKDDALNDLHEMHVQVVQREADQQRISAAQAAEQQRIDEAASALARQAEEVAEQRRAIEAAAPPAADDQAPVVDAEFFDPVVDAPVDELVIPLLVESDALGLAEFFHATYERLAPSFGYETRVESRAFDPTSAQGRLMVAVCEEVLAARLIRPVCDVD